MIRMLKVSYLLFIRKMMSFKWTFSSNLLKELFFCVDVSLRVGQKTNLRYFMIEIHYMDPVKSKFKKTYTYSNLTKNQMIGWIKRPWQYKQLQLLAFSKKLHLSKFIFVHLSKFFFIALSKCNSYHIES